MQILSRLESIDSNSKNYWAYSLFSLLFFAVLILVRYPGFALEPRFWAEESLYFETFLHVNNWWEGFDALVYPAYYIGLLRLAGLLATFTELELAPIVTTYFAFSISIIPLLILFFTKCKYWESLQQKIMLSFFLIFSCSTGEIWLTSTNLGFIFPVVSFLILLDDNLESKIKRILYCVLLSCAVFTGPITLIMAPFFVIRFFQTRQKQFLTYCSILLFLGLLHVLYYLVSANAGVSSPSRFVAEFSPLKSLTHLVSSNLIFPLFGYFVSIVFRTGLDVINIGIENTPYLEMINNKLPDFLVAGIGSIFHFFTKIKILVNGFIISSLIFGFYYLAKKESFEGKVYFLLLFVYLSTVIGLLSLKGLGGLRYSYITSFILLFYLYQRLALDKEKLKNNLVKFLLVFSVAISVIEYYPRTISFTPENLVGEKANWPVWKQEVRRWEMDNNYQPRVWPYIKKTTGPWPDRTTIWRLDLNEPISWKNRGRKKFSEEFLKLFSSRKIKVEDLEKIR
jgi:hypothetical protein